MGFPQPETGSVTEDVGVVGGFLTATGDADFGPFTNNDSGAWTAETLSGAYGSELVIDSDGKRRDIQLKGSGPTPYSRMGDGRAWVGPVLREYLISEAMHALGVPTTRALAAVATGEPILRETGALPGAIAGFKEMLADHRGEAVIAFLFQALAAWNTAAQYLRVVQRCPHFVARCGDLLLSVQLQDERPPSPKYMSFPALYEPLWIMCQCPLARAGDVLATDAITL